MEKFEYQYPHPAVATDCVVFGFDGYELKVLLIQRGVEPYEGMWALPGGFLRMDETAETCVRRELLEETGLWVNEVRQLGVFSDVHRDPRERVVSIAFYALARQADVRGGDDAAGAQWWKIDDVPQLAFDHENILRAAVQRIRQDIHFEPVGFGLLGEEFTMSELQRLYESILGVQFDRRNFHRKMLQTGILREVEDKSVDEKLARIRYRVERQQYFGELRELKLQSIDALFGSADAPKSAPMCEADEVDDPQRRNTVGRKGKLFRFDKERYDRMKQDGDFRLEF